LFYILSKNIAYHKCFIFSWSAWSDDSCSEQTRLSVFEVSILPLSTIFCLNFGIVQRVWYFLLEFWNCSESVVFFAWILELFRECGIFCFSIYCHTKNYMESTITILNTSMIKPRVSDVSVLSSFNYVQLPDSNHYILLSMLICFYTAMNLNWWLNFKKTCLSNHRLLVYLIGKVKSSCVTFILRKRYV
jgi:hypothetical protein